MEEELVSRVVIILFHSKDTKCQSGMQSYRNEGTRVLTSQSVDGRPQKHSEFREPFYELHFFSLTLKKQ